MIPLSTAKLRPGDICFIPRTDGRYVPFAFLCNIKNKRSSLYGGLLSAVVDNPSLESLPASLSVLKGAHVHISSYKENNTPIVGNVAERIGIDVLSSIEKDINNLRIGYSISVWGHRTIVKYASEVVA